MGLITVALFGIALLLWLIMKVKLEPFVALLVAGFVVALIGGIPAAEIVGTTQRSETVGLVKKGVGGILGSIAVVVGLGSMLGAMLEASGGAQVLADRLIRRFGEERAPLAMGLTGLIFGIPVFFDIGIFVLAPLVYVAAIKSKRSILIYCLPLIAGLSIMHAFLPPHPGPVAAAGLLNVDLGWLIIMGLACGIPAWIAGGYFFSKWIGERIYVPVPEELVSVARETVAVEAEVKSHAHGGTVTVRRARGRRGVASARASDARHRLGDHRNAARPHPLGHRREREPDARPGPQLLRVHRQPVRRSHDRPAHRLLCPRNPAWLASRRNQQGHVRGAEAGRNDSLVVGAGGFFGAVLQATGVGSAVAKSLTGAGLPAIALAYLISAGLRIAQGSATVAIIATAGIVGPLMTAEHFSQAQSALLVISISAGSIIASHVNDGGFWIVSRYFGIPVKETLYSWTVLETVLSVAGFIVAAILSLIVP